MKIATIIGARPQFIKAAVISREIARRRNRGESIDECLIHTGQHFDANMSDVFFRQMEIPPPSHHLGIAGGGHGEMTGRMLEAIERILRNLETSRPDWVLVYGDTNSTLAGALAAAKLHIPVAHVEAGLRSFNRAMPEEINRVLTDHASDLLLAPTRTAIENLHREGVPADRIALVGDVMYDAMIYYRERVGAAGDGLRRLKLEPRGYVLATVHRAENTDDPDRLRGIIGGLSRIAAELPVVLPLHPRTRQALDRAGLLDRTEAALRLIEPVGYLDMIALEIDAALIATDSGGVQKEAYFHRVPCLTLRDETEWVELIDAGANILAGSDPDRIFAAFKTMRDRAIDPSGLYGDGAASTKIIDRLRSAAMGDAEVAAVIETVSSGRAVGARR